MYLSENFYSFSREFSLILLAALTFTFVFVWAVPQQALMKEEENIAVQNLRQSLRKLFFLCFMFPFKTALDDSDDLAQFSARPSEPAYMLVNIFARLKYSS